MRYEICPECEYNHLKVLEESMIDYDPKTYQERVIGTATVFRCPECNWYAKLEEVSETFQTMP